MKNEIKVPSLGESISEATIGEILTPTGTVVKADAEILELETDKVNQVLYAPQAGRVLLKVKPGDVVKIGQIIGIMESASEKEAPQQVKEVPQQVKAKEQSKEKADEPLEKADEPFSSEELQKSSLTFETPVSLSLSQNSPIRYTKEFFLNDLQDPDTKIKEEIQPIEKVAFHLPFEQDQVGQRETRRPMSKIRKVIAQRMVEAQRTAAMLTTFNEVDLTLIIQLREKYKEAFIKKYGCKLGFMSFFIKATVSALQAFPDFNSYIDGEDIVHRNYYDIGVAVGTERGVIVPIVRHCEQLSFAEIEQSIEIYAKQAKEGTLTMADLQGGGFTITNGGVYGSMLSTPILIPPQCGILGMHKIEKRPVVIDDQIVIRSMMYLALSYDHRLVDGKEAVSFLVHLKNILEDPARLVLDL